MQDVTKKTYVFAVAPYTFDNHRDDFRDVKAQIHGICFGYKKAIGFFENQKEHSFMVLGDLNTEKGILEICKTLNQRYFLRIHNDSFTELVDVLNPKNVEGLGYWKKTDNQPEGNYTFDGLNFWTVEK